MTCISQHSQKHSAKLKSFDVESSDVTLDNQWSE